MRADMRLLTAIAVIGLCGYSVVHGWRVAHFSVAMASDGSPAKRIAIIMKWTAVPDVASAALRTELREKIDSSDHKAAERRREALWSILSIKPLSSIDWLSLSVMQLVMGQPTGRALNSLKLSMLTGPNEAYVMAERGVFGVSQWERLSPDLKTDVARDLVLALFPRNRIEGDASNKLRAVLFAKSERVRMELKEALLATGVSPERIEQKLKFLSAQPN
jgi:hypothetical protein